MSRKADDSGNSGSSTGKRGRRKRKGDSSPKNLRCAVHGLVSECTIATVKPGQSLEQAALDAVEEHLRRGLPLMGFGPESVDAVSSVLPELVSVDVPRYGKKTETKFPFTPTIIGLKKNVPPTPPALSATG